MKRTILCIIMVLLSCEVYSQCNVSSKHSLNGELAIANPEAIYESASSTGMQKVFANIQVVTDRKDTIFTLVIGSYAGGSMQAVTPREVSISFNNDSHQQISLRAFRFLPKDSKVPPDIIGEDCEFYLSNDILQAIKMYGIAQIVVIDERAKISVSSHPYSKLLQEQVNCLEVELRGSR